MAGWLRIPKHPLPWPQLAHHVNNTVGQGKPGLEATEAAHIVRCVEGKAQQLPREHAYPDSVTEADAVVRQRCQRVRRERFHAVSEGVEGLRVLAQLHMRIGLVPEFVCNRPALRLIHSGNQCRIDHVEFVKERLKLNFNCRPISVWLRGVNRPQERRRQNSGRSSRQTIGQFDGLEASCVRQWDVRMPHCYPAGIGLAFSMPDEKDAAGSHGLRTTCQQ